MPYADLETQKKAQHEWYLKKKALCAKRSRETRKRARAWLDDQKDKPCMDCGNKFPPCVMDFHHREPVDKLHTVSWLLLNASRKRILDEIEKCDILCANCHRIREYF